MGGHVALPEDGQMYRTYQLFLLTTSRQHQASHWHSFTLLLTTNTSKEVKPNSESLRIVVNPFGSKLQARLRLGRKTSETTIAMLLHNALGRQMEYEDDDQLYYCSSNVIRRNEGRGACGAIVMHK
ncbi:unnamed protein product [Calypogeia fissa]